MRPSLLTLAQEKGRSAIEALWKVRRHGSRREWPARRVLLGLLGILHGNQRSRDERIVYRPRVQAMIDAVEVFPPGSLSLKLQQ
jgi:hypothetical protein